MTALPRSRQGALALAFVGASTATFLTACAAFGAPSDGAGVEVRVLVRLVRPSDDSIAIGAEATRRAGVPVTYAAASSTAWHALALHCASAAQCESAIERLRAASTVYESVVPEGRKTRS